MNIFMKIGKRLFSRRKSNSSTTDITVKDLSRLKLTRYEDLDDVNKAKAQEYIKSIDVHNLESLLEYNNDISAEVRNLSLLLHQYIEELNEVVRLDDKTEYELQKMEIDLAIKNIKVVVVEEMMNALRTKIGLKRTAIEKYIEDFQKKESIIEFFSKAARIKRNTQLETLKSVEMGSRYTLQLLDDQLSLIGLVGSSDKLLLNKITEYINVGDRLVFDRKVHEENQKKIYEIKINRLIKLSQYFGWKFSKLEELKRALEDETSLKDNKLFYYLAVSEVEVDDYALGNKNRLISYFTDIINKLKDIDVIDDNESFIKDAETIYLISKLIPNDIDEANKKLVYKLMFKASTIDINKETIPLNLFAEIVEEDEIRRAYYEIIDEKLDSLNRGKSEVATSFVLHERFKGMKKILDKYFKKLNIMSDGISNMYGYDNFLSNKSLLALLLAFDSHEAFGRFFKEYSIPRTSVALANTDRIKWSDFLPRETIYELYRILGGKEPDFYDVYKYYFLDIPEKLMVKDPVPFVNYYSDHAPRSLYMPTICYYLPEGLIRLQAFEVGVEPIDPETDHVLITRTGTQEWGNVRSELLKSIRENSWKRTVVFPSSLEVIMGNIFGDTKIGDFKLNKGIKVIGNNVFLKQLFIGTRKIEIPPSLVEMGTDSFNFRWDISEIEFKDFKNSKLLYKLLTEQKISNLYLLVKIFGLDNLCYGRFTKAFKAEDYNSFYYINLKDFLYGKKDSYGKENLVISCERLRQTRYRPVGPEWYTDEELLSKDVLQTRKEFLPQAQGAILEAIESQTGINLIEYYEESGPVKSLSIEL